MSVAKKAEVIEMRLNERPPRAVRIPITKIDRYKQQPRTYFDPRGLASLGRSIQLRGQLTPGLVKKVGRGWQLIEGERRFRAIKEHTKLRTFVAFLVSPKNDKEHYLMSLVANKHREDLTDIDQARAIVKLRREFSMSDDDIASELGVSAYWVRQLARLPESLHEKVQSMMEGSADDDRRINVSTALLIAGLEKPKQLALAAEIRNRGLKLPEIRALVRRAVAQGHRRDGIRGRKPDDDYKVLFSFVDRTGARMDEWHNKKENELERLVRSRNREDLDALLNATGQVILKTNTLFKKLKAVRSSLS